MKITLDNLNFKIITLKDKNELQIFKLSNFEYNNEQLAIILSQKTNFIEGNTTNLFDAQLMIGNEKTKGNYTLTETREIKKSYKLYFSILTNKNLN